MFWLAAAAAIATSAPPTQGPTAARVQARVTVRILEGVRLKLDSPTNAGAPRARDSIVVTQGGERQPAKLIEFE
jgi:hypothetical protein